MSMKVNALLAVLAHHSETDGLKLTLQSAETTVTTTVVLCASLIPGREMNLALLLQCDPLVWEDVEGSMYPMSYADFIDVQAARTISLGEVTQLLVCVKEDVDVEICLEVHGALYWSGEVTRLEIPVREGAGCGVVAHCATIAVDNLEAQADHELEMAPPAVRANDLH